MSLFNTRDRLREKKIKFKDKADKLKVLAKNAIERAHDETLAAQVYKLAENPERHAPWFVCHKLPGALPQRHRTTYGSPFPRQCRRAFPLLALLPRPIDLPLVRGRSHCLACSCQGLRGSRIMGALEEGCLVGPVSDGSIEAVDRYISSKDSRLGNLRLGARRHPRRRSSREGRTRPHFTKPFTGLCGLHLTLWVRVGVRYNEGMDSQARKVRLVPQPSAGSYHPVLHHPPVRRVSRARVVGSTIKGQEAPAR